MPPLRFRQVQSGGNTLNRRPAQHVCGAAHSLHVLLAKVLLVRFSNNSVDLSHTRRVLPIRVGQLERRTSNYKRHGATSLVAALDIGAGNAFGWVHAPGVFDPTERRDPLARAVHANKVKRPRRGEAGTMDGASVWPEREVFGSGRSERPGCSRPECSATFRRRNALLRPLHGVCPQSTERTFRARCPCSVANLTWRPQR